MSYLSIYLYYNINACIILFRACVYAIAHSVLICMLLFRSALFAVLFCAVQVPAQAQQEAQAMDIEEDENEEYEKWKVARTTLEHDPPHLHQHQDPYQLALDHTHN